VGCEPHRGVEPAQVEVVLERDGQPVQRADGLTRAGKVLVARAGRGEGAVEARLGETVCLRESRQ